VHSFVFRFSGIVSIDDSCVIRAELIAILEWCTPSNRSEPYVIYELPLVCDNDQVPWMFAVPRPQHRRGARNCALVASSRSLLSSRLDWLQSEHLQLVKLLSGKCLRLDSTLESVRVTLVFLDFSRTRYI
jgi:hypothetical protein